MPTNAYETGHVPEEEWRRLAAEDVINTAANRFTTGLIGPLESGSVVLDIGAGSSPAVREHVRSHDGTLYVAMDANQEAVATHQQDPEEPGVFALHGNVRDGLGFGSESADVINARYLLAFLDIDTRRRVMGEMLRILKPGGRIILTDYDWSVVDGSEDVQRLRDIGLAIRLFDADYGDMSAAEASSFLPDDVTITTQRFAFPHPLTDYEPLLKLGYVIPQGLLAENDGERLAQEAEALFARLREESTSTDRQGYRWPDAVAVIIEKPTASTSS